MTWEVQFKKERKKERALVSCCNQHCVFTRTIPGSFEPTLRPKEKYHVYGLWPHYISGVKPRFCLLSSTRSRSALKSISLGCGGNYTNMSTSLTAGRCCCWFICEVKLSGVVTSKWNEMLPRFHFHELFSIVHRRLRGFERNINASTVFLFSSSLLICNKVHRRLLTGIESQWC